jgi:hypothetical protein
LAIGTLRAGPNGGVVSLQFASGSSGFKVWVEQGGSRVLNATGLALNGWQQTLTRQGTGFSGTELTATANIQGRVCPPNVFLNYSNMLATNRCVYYDGGNPQQGYAKDTGVETEDWLSFWNRTTSGQGATGSYYEGNLKTCADKGMRLPTSYEISTTSHCNNCLPPSATTPTFAGSADGVPSYLGGTWTSSASTCNTFDHCGWSGTSAQTFRTYGNYETYTRYVRCLLPSH